MPELLSDRNVPGEKRLIQLLDAFGSDPSRWPDEAAGAAFLAQLPHSRPLQQAWEAALELEALLQEAPEADPSPASLARVRAGLQRALAASPPVPARRWLPAFLSGWKDWLDWQSMGALSASCAVLLVLAFSPVSTTRLSSTEPGSLLQSETFALDIR